MTEILEGDYLDGLNRKEEQAFNKVHSKYWSKIFHFVQRYLKDDRQEANLLTNDVFLKLLKIDKPFPNEASVKGFLYTAAKNASIDGLRARKRTSKHLDRLPPDNWEKDFELSPAEAMENVEFWKEIAELIRALPPKCSETMRLLYEEGAKPDEICRELDVMLSTMHGNKYRGLKVLRDALRKRGWLLPFLMAFLSDKSSN